MEFKLNKSILILLIFLSSVLHHVQGKKILCLLGVGSKTAQKWNKVLLTELSNKGYDLTVITPSLWDLEKESNINFIYLEKTHKFLKERYENTNTRNDLEQSNWKLIINWYYQHMATCRENLESIGLSEALDLGFKGEHAFDMIIYDVSYGPGCLLHMAYFFDSIPIVGITSSYLTSNILNIYENSVLYMALKPYTLSDFGKNMNYFTRVYNAALYGFDYLYRQWVVGPVIEGQWSHNRLVKNLNISKSLNELLPRFKVILANHHSILHTLTSLPANIVPVPGLHIQPNLASKRNSSLLSFIENSKSDMILIDLQLNQLVENDVFAILKIVQKFSKYKFIWTTGKGKKIIKNKPLNLFIEKDLENHELLGLLKDFAKIKFILTTPDILNIQECLYYGIPMVTLILKPEQRYLAKRIEQQGIANNLNGNSLTAATLTTTFEESLNDENLLNRAKQLKQSFKNQPIPSLKTAVWWIENILENPKANDYLISDNKESLGIFAKFSFDINLLIEILILICIFNIILIINQTIENLKKRLKIK